VTLESEALSKALEAAKDYADSILKAPLNQVGGMLADTVGYWRLKNRVRLMLKAKEWLEARQIKPEKLMPDIFVPLIEDGGNAEDETLAGMFASLLATHLDPQQQENVHPSYTKVLAQISPVDAKVLLEYRRYVSYAGAREVGLRGGGLPVEMIAKELSLPIRVAFLSTLNLWRLGIIERRGYRHPEQHPIPTVFENSPEHQLYVTTEYGIAFSDACQYDKRVSN